MVKSRPVDDRIAEIEEKQKQLEAQKRALIAQSKEQERKDRTRRLVRIGAIMDSMGIQRVEHADSLKMSCIEDQKLWKSIVLASGAPWPPPNKNEHLLELNKDKS